MVLNIHIGFPFVATRHWGQVHENLCLSTLSTQLRVLVLYLRILLISAGALVYTFTQVL